MRTYSIYFAAILAAALLGSLPSQSVAGEAIRIVALEPTLFFPKPKKDEPLAQIAKLKLANDGRAIAAQLKITLPGKPSSIEDLGKIDPKESVKEIHVPDLDKLTEMSLKLISHENSKTLAEKKISWQPQKKWKLYCVAYSHHDLGFGDYPHRLRTTIRHANITRPLQFCRDSDAWDDDSKFRFVIETSEPITSFLGSHSPEDAAELGRRLREGRIQLGGLHNTANTEQLNVELLARMFYLSNRHTRDLLGVPKCRTAQIDDVIGLTWPLATFCEAAEVPYFFHGPNGCGRCFEPAAREPVFYWQGPSPGSHVLVRSVAYGGYAGDNPGDLSEVRVRELVEKLGENWPYDALFVQEGTDFQLVTMDTANRIHAWNARWAYPRLVCSTMDMFFDEIAKQTRPEQIKSFSGDGNNQWADQDANDAWALGQARHLAEKIPTAEKFSAAAQIIAGNGNSWTDIYQAYHRLLAWHEHTNAIDFIAPDLERMRRYETELEENREMIRESGEFASKALDSAFLRLTANITRQSERSFIVFNPMLQPRTDTVSIDPRLLTPGDHILDPENRRDIAWQTLPDGSTVFVAEGVPPLGYKTFEIHRGQQPSAESNSPKTVVLENKFFRVSFDSATGTIISIRDNKRDLELVDQSAPHRFNEYLYERFETSDWNGPTTWHRVKSAKLKAFSGPVAQIMQVTAAPVGVESMSQTVILYADLPRIDFLLDMVKSPSGRIDKRPNTDPRGKESLYIALPLAIPDFQVRHELPGCVSEPVKDLFDGANTAFYAVQHFSDISNARFGVTVSAADSSLIQYDRPRSSPLGSGGESLFEKIKTPIATSRMYLYLMDNMFDVNVRWDQAGPARFTYSLQSHDGDWQQGKAPEFGWNAANPLQAVDVRGKHQGTLPPSSSFASIDQPNVICTTLKPAEANGAGYILRFVETQGRPTAATLSLPLLAPFDSARAVNLVEDDLPETLAVENGDRIALKLPAFGVKTIRVLHKSAPPAQLPSVAAKAVSNREIALSWNSPTEKKSISHYHVYRGTTPDFKPGLLNLVARPTETSCIDRPQLQFGGWINNRLEPATTYYYRVAAVDRWNRESHASPVIASTTMKSSKKNMQPLQVERLLAIPVSPVSRLNAVNLLWRTACESPGLSYEIHRSTAPQFEPGDATRIAVIDSSSLLRGGNEYGQTPIAYRLDEFDHLMYLDAKVEANAKYYYRVRTVDTDGQKGPFSREVEAATKGPDLLDTLSISITAQSVYAPQYGKELAIDGSPDPYAAWISKPYGGGTKEKPQDVWWAFEFPAGNKLALSGVKIIGDHRDIIPLQKKMLVQVRRQGEWKTVGQIADSTTKNLVIKWPDAVETDAIRIFVPSTDLPVSSQADIDGIVRIAELYFLLPDGTESTPLELFKGQLGIPK
jgi:hypothetical protein